MAGRERMEEKQLIGGRYRIRREIGRGGTSRVYEVKDQKLGCLRAAKVLDLADAGAEESFLKEGALLAGLDHPSIPGVSDMAEDQGKLCLIMDLVEGRTLAEVLEERGRLPVSEVLDLGLQLTEILSYLHDQGLVYRDLKLSNLILGQGGRLFLIDFGACRRYGPARDRDTRLLGTEGYAAPEQYDPAAPTTPRTDLYGLGVLLYVLLSGRPPESARLPLEPVPGAGRDLMDLVEACLAEDPAGRPRDARTVRALLAGAAAGRERKRRDLMGGRALVLLGLLFLTGGLWLVLTAAAPLPEARVLGILPPGDRYEDDPSFYLSVLTEGEEEGLVFSTDTPGVIDLEADTGLVTPLAPGTAHVTASLGGTRAEIRFRILEAPEIPEEEEAGGDGKEEEAPARTEDKEEAPALREEEETPSFREEEEEPVFRETEEEDPGETPFREEEGAPALREEERKPEAGEGAEEEPGEEEGSEENESIEYMEAEEETVREVTGEETGQEGESAVSLPVQSLPAGEAGEPEGREAAEGKEAGRLPAGAVLLALGLVLVLGGSLLIRRGRPGTR